jgi:hypothetical protein
MPLTWDISKCVDVDAIKEGPEWGITETLIFGTMGTGIGHITEKNEAEFYAPMHIMEQLYGPLLTATRDGKRIERPIMPFDVHRRIGLRTNAAYKDESRASFVRRHVTNGALRDGLYKYGRALKASFEGYEYTFEERQDEILVAAAS